MYSILLNISQKCFFCILFPKIVNLYIRWINIHTHISVYYCNIQTYFQESVNATIGLKHVKYSLPIKLYKMFDHLMELFRVLNFITNTYDQL